MNSFKSYKNPALAVDVVVFGYQDNRLSVLLLKRKEAPFKNVWTLPGAFLQMEETFLNASSRVIRTKLGMDKIYMEQLYSFDAPARDPRGRVVSVAYYALVNPSKVQMMAGTMANDVQWFDVKDQPVLGFDHSDIVVMALQRLKGKIMYYPLGFELLDEEFTMTELQDLYECVLDTTIDRRNFSRKILDAAYVMNTGRKRSGSKNRHPELYIFNKHLQANKFQLNIK